MLVKNIKDKIVDFLLADMRQRMPMEIKKIKENKIKDILKEKINVEILEEKKDGDSRIKNTG